MHPIPGRLLRRMINYTISIDGNISSGKSTLIKRLAKDFPKLQTKIDVDIIAEPLEKWRDVRGHNLLSEYYEDPVRNNFLFQHYVQLTRLMDTVTKLKPLEDLRETSDCDLRVRIMERSLQNNRYCFIEMAKRQGGLSDPEYSVLIEWYDWLDKHLDLSLDLIIYLRTTPDIVHQRMKSRGREEESSVPLTYLQDLHSVYEEWLLKSQINGSRKVIVVDANVHDDVVFQEARTKLSNILGRVIHCDETSVANEERRS